MGHLSATEWYNLLSLMELKAIGVGDGGVPPPKIRGNFFSDNFYVKFGHFRAKSGKISEFC